MTILFSLVSLLLGIGLGFLYFGGLWVTVSRHHPHAAARAVTGRQLPGAPGGDGGLLYPARPGGHGERLLVCLAGVVLVQAAMMRKFGRKKG